MLKDKKIVLGVSGSIAAYKSALLIRHLIKAGAEVKVVMTPSASDFITPLTLSTLSKRPVYKEFIKNDQGEWNNHVELGLWADLLLIAPASANTLAKMANGLCDNLLTAIYLSARSPVMVAPAMDLDMFQHLSTQRNIKQLRQDGVKIIDVESGELASGLSGPGRMAEPEAIIKELEGFFLNDFTGKKVLITAGPTQESIDPVRFISNHSSGKMGYSIAEEFALRGAKVTLISGPVSQNIQHRNIDVVDVKSAQEMNEKAEKNYQDADIAILSAAVADYAPSSPSDQKIKKKDQTLDIKLSKTPDIAQNLGNQKKRNQVNIGFALETHEEEANAMKKLKKKNFDLIVLNSLNDKGAGFGHDTNKISIVDKHNNVTHFELKSKREVARDVVNAIKNIL